MKFQWSWTPQGATKNRFVAGSFLFVSVLLSILFYFLADDMVSRLAIGSLAGVFFLIGFVVIVLDIRGASPERINNIGGLMGALSFALPSIAQFPFLLKTDFWMSFVFFLLGLLTLVASIALFRYQERTGKQGWSKSWSTEDLQ